MQDQFIGTYNTETNPAAVTVGKWFIRGITANGKKIGTREANMWCKLQWDNLEAELGILDEL